MEREAILIIDDHSLFRSGLIAMLSTAFGDVAIVDVGSLDEALAVSATMPTVILLDIQLSNASGLEGMGLIQRRWPAARVVVERSGGRALARDVPCRSLTARRTEVLALVEQGLWNKVIGLRLALSEHTVRGHVQALLSGLGTAGRAEAAFKARQLGLIR